MPMAPPQRYTKRQDQSLSGTTKLAIRFVAGGSANADDDGVGLVLAANRRGGRSR